MSITNYLPRKEDYFPKLRRGHGLNRKHECCTPGCKGYNTPNSKIKHIDRAGNVDDWCAEHKVKHL